MTKFLKYLAFIFIFVISITLVSCSVLDNSSSNEETVTKTVSNGDVTLQLVNSKDTTYTTLEEAVAAVYDSVVCINVLSNNQVVSSGSGVIIGKNDSGYYYIATCCHVIDGYTDYIVTYSDGTYQEAELVGADDVTDLAVIRVKNSNELVMANLIADQANIRLASDCFAIGNPLGTLANSVTKGIISATSRNIKTSDGSVHNLLQTDCPINSGNSGGGLFNTQGELIGIVSAKYSATGVEGLGFAIPANTVRDVISSLIEKGYVVGRTNLGITLSDGYVRGNSFFSSYTRVVYISNVEESGSAYGLLKKNQIVVGVKVTIKATGETKELTNIADAETVNNFLDNLNLEIGDVVTFTVKNGLNAEAEEVAVTLKQYIYGA